VEGILVLRNSKGEDIVNVPFLKVLDDPTRPWVLNQNNQTLCSPKIAPPLQKMKWKLRTDLFNIGSHSQPQAAFHTTATPKKSGIMPKFKSSKKSSRGTLNFNASTSSGQKHPSKPLNSQSPNQSAAPSPVNLEEKLDNASSDGKPQSALKSLSYATPLQNPLPAAPSPTTSPTSQPAIGLGELPKNRNGALFVVLLVPPVPPTAHPCNSLVGGIQVFLRIGSKFDRSLVLCPAQQRRLTSNHSCCNSTSLSYQL
jgi:hypothetical protein